MIRLFGRTELKKSLKTTDRKEAKAAAAALAFRVQTIFLRIRSGMLTDRELERIAVELIQEFSGRLEGHKRERKDALDWLFTDGGLFPLVDIDQIDSTLQLPRTETSLADQISWYTSKIAALQKEASLESFSRETRNYALRIAKAKNLDIELPADGWFHEPGFTIPSRYDAEFDEYIVSDEEPPTPEEEGADLEAWYRPAPVDFNSLCLTVLNAQIDAFSLAMEKALSKRKTPLQLQMTERIEAAKPRPRLSQLWEVYRDTNKANWTEGSLDRNTGLYAQILDILGDRELSELEDEQQAIKLRDMLKLYPNGKEKKKAFAGKPFSPVMAKHKDFKPLSDSSMEKVIDLISSLIKFAMKNRKKWGIDCNVFAGTQPKDTRPEDTLRTEYEQHEIQALIDVLKTIRVRWEPERFWIPLLALYTGARQNELCQLRTADVTEIDGILYIEICHKPELNQTTKTKKSRTCPIHPDLVALGFLDYCRNQRHDRLWPNLTLYKGKWQHEFSKWYCTTFRKKFCNPKVRKLDFHGLRHTFLDWFKQNSAVNFDTAKVLKSIVGHLDKFDVAIIGAVADDMTFDRYGKAYKVKKQSELIEKLNYGVDILHLREKLK
jgi:integrase